MEYRFNDLVRTHTHHVFGKKQEELKDILFDYRQPSHEIKTLEQAMLALGEAMEQEQMLSHGLSRTQMMLSEKEDMFEKAVDVGEHYKVQLENLMKQMEEHHAENSLLQADFRMIKERNMILEETIEDQQMEIASLIRAIKMKDYVISNSSAMVAAQSELPNEDLGWKKIESGMQEA